MLLLYPCLYAKLLYTKKKSIPEQQKSVFMCSRFSDCTMYTCLFTSSDDN